MDTDDESPGSNNGSFTEPGVDEAEPAVSEIGDFRSDFTPFLLVGAPSFESIFRSGRILQLTEKQSGLHTVDVVVRHDCPRKKRVAEEIPGVEAFAPRHEAVSGQHLENGRKGIPPLPRLHGR